MCLANKKVLKHIGKFQETRKPVTVHLDSNDM